MLLDKNNSINNILEENRIFPPSKEFSSKSSINKIDQLFELKNKAKEDPIAFWKSYAESEIDWFQSFETVLNEDNAPFYEWFKEGKLNITYNISFSKIPINRMVTFSRASTMYK